ncbi:MarR family winged helix-turn-helix transcriptional regulator [Streptomyces sp. NBC_00582]|uniref:MarR family winged helix-turn-helix transcriptional regulator n=1 Tax=Streptomyces sp. NBC_00582 TaxID=2975783 RepID=UPI002E821F7D|nr:MarR family transcriptional regulator [Streptomyces sp. NBC_00582]WUB67430.1 MarR family transcriptional regulator [Streptomyces sp. NBC_00582]
MTEVGLSRRELQVWRRLAAVLVVLPEAVEAQLQRDGGLTQFGYGVLAALSEAPGHRMRMSELAHMARGSQSRLSHMMVGLERRGWVRRERAAEDGRGNLAVLTEAGYAKLAALAPGHVGTVRRAVIDALSPRQLDELEGICAALLPSALRERERILGRHGGDAAERPQIDDVMSAGGPDRHSTARREPTPTVALTRLLACATDRADRRPPHHATPAADPPDPTDGLSLLSEARREIDLAELELIDRARAGGQTWEQIAAALDMPDRRQAQTRYRRLRERWLPLEPDPRG